MGFVSGTKEEQTMLQELKKEANYTFTENGALTYSSTMNHCLDLFATIGGLRNAEETEIVNRFIRAYTENPDVAMKVLFYARDVRGGLGERRAFRIILRYLCETHAASVKKNIEYIAEYGRYDDLLVLMDTPCESITIEFLKKQLGKDIEMLRADSNEISLLAKWLPSVNTSNVEKVRLGRKLAKAFGMSEREYRKTLSALRKKIDIIENYLREVDYSFDYEKQPSKAMLKCRKAFHNHDHERYTLFMEKVSRNEATLHTGTLMPYEIIRPFYVSEVSDEEAKSLDVTWNAQEDYIGEQNSLVVIDGSGSMYCNNLEPITVAHSLGLYFAERNRGEFANHFITFSRTPQLVEIKGNDLLEKIRYMASYNEVANTNIQAVFELILKTAVKNNLPQKEMPERIIIVSDMEFDRCADSSKITNFEYAKKIFEEAGYTLPKVVFWNVASRKLQTLVTQNEQGVTLVSGYNARLFEQILTDNTDPYSYMMEIVDSERYEKIVA